MFVCVTVCGEAGPRWVCVPEGRLQSGQEPGGSQAHPAHEGWRDQTHSNAPQHTHTHGIKMNTFARCKRAVVFFRHLTWNQGSCGKVSSTPL